MFYPCKCRKRFRAQIHYLVKASGDLKMRNCFTLPYIFGSYFPIALIKKKGFGSQNIQGPDDWSGLLGVIDMKGEGIILCSSLYKRHN